MSVIWRVIVAVSLVSAGGLASEPLGVEELSWPLDVLVPGIVIVPAVILVVPVVERLTGRQMW